MPMQLWSLEGAVEALGDLFIVDRLDSRTHERGHTKTFSCWVWAADVAHIPTKCTLWRAARGAGRVEAMLGFSPPSPTGRPAPGVRRRELLVHVDRIEDWTPCTSQSSSSHQSGLPSSGSGEERPFPAVYPGTWTRHVEDGQGRRQPPAVPPPAATACSVEAAVGTTMTTTTAAGAGAPGRTRCSDGATPTRHQWWPRIAPSRSVNAVAPPPVGTAAWAATGARLQSAPPLPCPCVARPPRLHPLLRPRRTADPTPSSTSSPTKKTSSRPHLASSLGRPSSRRPSPVRLLPHSISEGAMHTSPAWTSRRLVGPCMQPSSVQACRTAPPPPTTATELGAVTHQVEQLQLGRDGAAAQLLFRETPPHSWRRPHRHGGPPPLPRHVRHRSPSGTAQGRRPTLPPLLSRSGPPSGWFRSSGSWGQRSE
ncbi:hypothetical protein VPH35_014100 [Triticum aestivum]